MLDIGRALAVKAAELQLCRGAISDAGMRRVHVRRVRRGVYCLDATRNPTFEESLVAALLVLPVGSMACGLSAARLWRLDALVPVKADEPLEILVPGRHNSARLAGCKLRFDGLSQLTLPMGIPATSRERTIIDLVAQLEFAPALALVEAAIHGDPESTTALAAEHRRTPAGRRLPHVRNVLEFASPLSESVLESYARALWWEAGLPTPTQQAVIRDAANHFVGRVDFLWQHARLIVEVDGLAKYAEQGALQAEKRRQNALVACGYTVLRFTWSDIRQRPEHVIATVRRALRVVGK